MRRLSLGDSTFATISVVVGQYLSAVLQHSERVGHVVIETTTGFHRVSIGRLRFRFLINRDQSMRLHFYILLRNF